MAEPKAFSSQRSDGIESEHQLKGFRAGAEL